MLVFSKSMSQDYGLCAPEKGKMNLEYFMTMKPSSHFTTIRN